MNPGSAQGNICGSAQGFEPEWTVIRNFKPGELWLNVLTFPSIRLPINYRVNEQ